MRTWNRSLVQIGALTLALTLGGAAFGTSAAGATAYTPRTVATQSQPHPHRLEQDTDAEGSDSQAGADAETPDAADAADAETPDSDLASKATITAEQAQAAALAVNPGVTVVNTQLEDEDGTVVYNVSLSNGTDVKINAQTGALVKTEPSDDRNDAQLDSETTDD